MWNFFVQIMKDVLSFFYQLTGNYGLAIVMLTVVVKLVLYPLTHQQFKSMRDMQKMQPLMKEMQAKFKDKPEELQRRMLALYKEHKVNPLGGCLPLLVQMPILFMLYSTVMSFRGDFAGQSFLWINSLALPDIPLLLLYAVSLFLSSKLTVSDPSQAQTQNTLAIIMPFMFTFMAWIYKWPAAFILYWLVFNILSTVQQYYVMRAPGITAAEKPAE